MWLKQLQLTNFQKHADLTINFTPGVNILYGHSDEGKSCIRRAIAWLCDLESYNEETIRKEGTKKTSVRGLYDNGVEIERVRSSSINRYVTTVNGKKTEYDSVGKECPEEVRNLIQMSLVEIDEKNKLNLNIAEQVSLPFLQNVPASTRLKLFNKLTGNDLLDAVVQNINKEIINIRRTVTVQENVVKTNEPEIEKLGLQITLKKKTLDAVKKHKEAIEAKYEKLVKLTALMTRIQAAQMSIEETKAALSGLKSGDDSRITPLKEQCGVLTRLCTLKDALHLCKNKLYLAQNDLKAIKVSEVSGDALRANIALLEKVVGLQAQIAVIQTRIATVKGDYKPFLDGLLPKLETEYKEILKEAGVCPTCKQACDKVEHVQI